MMAERMKKTGPMGKIWEEAFTIAAGSLLRQTRERTGIGRPELAAMVGSDVSQLCRWEGGRVLPRLHWLAKLAEALNVDVSALIPRL